MNSFIKKFFYQKILSPINFITSQADHQYRKICNLQHQNLVKYLRQKRMKLITLLQKNKTFASSISPSPITKSLINLMLLHHHFFQTNKNLFLKIFLFQFHADFLITIIKWLVQHHRDISIYQEMCFYHSWKQPLIFFCILMISNYIFQA